MDNGTVLFATLLITAVIGVVIQIALYKQRKIQNATYPILWNRFEMSLKANSHDEIIELGHKLVYNKFVSTKHLEIIQKVAQELESQNPDFKKLRLNAYNKWIHHKKGKGYGY